MLVTIAGVVNEWGGQDLSPYVDRQSTFEIDSSLGSRLDTLEMTLFDAAGIIAIPKRAEIVVYDATVSNTWVLGQAPIVYPTGSANSLSVAAASFESSGTGWTAGANATIARSNAQFIDGSWSLAITATANGDASASSAASTAVLPGQTWTALVSFLAATARRTVNVFLDWYTSAFSLISSVASTGVTDNVPGATYSSWVQCVATGIAPAGAAWCAVRAYITGCSASEVHYIDLASVAPNANPYWTPGGLAPSNNAPLLGSSTWTPRLFGGYCSGVQYNVLAGMQRNVVVKGQDYTIRNRTTIVNKAYGPDSTHPGGWTDDQIIKDLYSIYRPDVDTQGVTSAFQTFGQTMPKISFPTHSLEQMLTRVVKITQGWYRIDYYKRLSYGGVGQSAGSYPPFVVSDNPTGLAAAPRNQLFYDQSDFEGGLDSWSAYSQRGSIVQTSTIASHGTSCMQITGNATSTQVWLEATSVPLNPATTPATVSAIGKLVPVVPGQTWTALGQIRSATQARAWTINVGWVAASGMLIGIASSSAITSSTMAWTLLSNTVVAPPGAAYALLDVSTYPTAIPSGEVHYLDQCSLAQGTSLVWDAGGAPTIGCEQAQYAPDFSSVFDRTWIIGGQFTGKNVTYPLTPSAGSDGVTQVFSLPATVDNATSATVTVGGVALVPQAGQTHAVGILGQDGQLSDLPSSGGSTAGWKFPAVIGTSVPPQLVLQNPPTAGQQVSITGAFRYPLIQIVTDPVLLQQLNGTIFENVIRDNRITDQGLAIQVGQQQIASEGYDKRGGSLVISEKGRGTNLLQPGQYISISHVSLFQNLLPGGTTKGSFLITQLTSALTEDISEPWLVTVQFADRPDSDDDSVFDHTIGEAGRINAALSQPDVDDTVQDLQTLTDTITFGSESVTVGKTHAANTYPIGDPSAQIGAMTIG